MRPDYYQLLGVPSTATQPEIRSAYLQLVRRHHPDVNKAAGASDFLTHLNLAYEVLSDATRRASYDATLRRAQEEAARRAYEERLRSNPPPPEAPPKAEPSAKKTAPPPPPPPPPPPAPPAAPTFWQRATSRNGLTFLAIAVSLAFGAWKDFTGDATGEIPSRPPVVATATLHPRAIATLTQAARATSASSHELVETTTQTPDPQ